MDWAWVVLWAACGGYAYTGVMTGPLRADLSGERVRPCTLSFNLDALKLGTPPGVALFAADWRNLQGTTLAMPPHLQVGLATTIAGVFVALFVLQWPNLRDE